MARNTSVQQFRNTATPEDWKKVVEDHENLSKEDFEAKYRFTWSGIMNDAAERGYYEKKRFFASPARPQQKADGTDVFIVAALPADIKKVSRSVQLNEDVYNRLLSLEHNNGQYTHSSILNQLLDDALKKYGY